MSCLNVKLPPAKKAWKSFKSKLQIKLHKLHKSKGIKKPKYRLNTKSAKAIRPPVFFEQQDQSRRRLVHKRNSRLNFQRKSAPVYIDKLFREPVVELVAKCPASPKNMKLLEEQGAMVPGTSNEEGKETERSCEADDMWESLGFASPQMQGIDERAEQFISSFRADMRLQEMLARGL